MCEGRMKPADAAPSIPVSAISGCRWQSVHDASHMEQRNGCGYKGYRAGHGGPLAYPDTDESGRSWLSWGGPGGTKA
jgi:hypothetical protein